MSDPTLTSWVLAAMAQLQPPSTVTPAIAASYAETAEAVARAAEEEPLFSGPDAVRETAALLLGVARHESSFRPWAVGDHGRSIGAFQIQAATSGDDPEDLLVPQIAARSAVRLVRQSMRICRDRPIEERLSWYASGGSECPDNDEALGDSRAMFALARRALATNRASSVTRVTPTFRPDFAPKKRTLPVVFIVYRKKEGSWPRRPGGRL